MKISNHQERISHYIRSFLKDNFNFDVNVSFYVTPSGYSYGIGKELEIPFHRFKDASIKEIETLLIEEFPLHDCYYVKQLIQTHELDLEEKDNEIAELKEQLAKSQGAVEYLERKLEAKGE